MVLSPGVGESGSVHSPSVLSPGFTLELSGGFSGEMVLVVGSLDGLLSTKDTSGPGATELSGTLVGSSDTTGAEGSGGVTGWEEVGGGVTGGEAGAELCAG